MRELAGPKSTVIEFRLGRLTTTGEPVEQGTVRHRAYRPDAEQHADVRAERGCGVFVLHERAHPFSGAQCHL
jgi:hypothetical protein